MKKKIGKGVSVALAVCMVGSTLTPAAVNAANVKADTAVEKVAKKVKAQEKALKDGVNDAWAQDEATVKGDDAVCAVEDGWLHLKGGSGNDNGNAPAVFKNPNAFDFSKEGFFEFTLKADSPNNDRFGIYLGYGAPKRGMFVGWDNGGWFWQKYDGAGDAWYQGQRTAFPEANTETKIRVEWTADKKLTLKVADAVVFDKEDFSAVPLTDAIAFKAATWSNEITEVYLKDIHYTGQEEEVVEEGPTTTIKSEKMDVVVAKDFPRVEKYNMDGKTFYGQTEAINTVEINGVNVAVTPENVEATFEADKAVYVMNVKDEENNVDAVVTAELVVKDNTLEFNITEIKNNLEDSVDGYPVQTISIPNHSLISVRSTQEGANLKGATMSSNVTISGDEYYEVTADTSMTNRDYMYAFVSNNELSAGLWSNSEHEGRAAYAGVTGGSHNTRIYATTETADDAVSLGLASAPWYYHRVVESATKVAEDGSKYTKQYMVEETEMPKTKIVITDDQNEDAQIDWNDGAVAFRSIMNNPFKSEEVPEIVAYRIAMNFGGHAQNPFLTTLDNVKRVAMHTDGLGQGVLLKGYGSEGHDSGHPDYADIGQRIGGAEDMNFLMTNGAKYGAKFGIHVNAGEMYPEAKAFSEDLVRRNADGGMRYGWNWIDQGVGIDSVYDLGEGLREARFDELEEKVGQNLDFVYVDIWGNCTGGNDDSWQTRKLSKEITDNGWRMTTEWGSTNEYDSTFQHWATDLTYGGYAMKGENSDVMRFLRNHQKDSWVGDYPRYTGAAMAPLLGGYNMKDFEGWQGRNDYDTYITNLYTHDLTTKFIQHYEIVKWVDGKEFTGTNPDGGQYKWAPEMEITLKEGDDTLVLERGSEDPNDAAYRDRTMTLNGKVIATGAASRGDRSNSDIQNGRNKGTEKYLLPWTWNSETGEKVAADDEKLYHWNTQGGTSEWELPDSWAGLENVKVYKLTDLGKTDETTVDVVDGKITLEAESEIPYVVCKGERGNLDITWSEGMHIVDAGFNSGNFDAWKQTGEGTAAIAKSQYSNPMMKLDGEIAMTQTLTDLEAGKQYAVLVGVDNRSDAKAIAEVKVDGKVVASNYTTRSIAKNYVKAYTHSTSSATVDGSSYFQNMYVFFTAPESGEVTLTVSREAGEGSTYVDDIRITKNESKNITTDDKGEVVKFEQDFETNVQGLYPFVVSGIEGVEDNRTHLSELHAPFTQAGWDVKKMDDVLDGKWSVKINGLCQRNTLAYQTIPQNFRFEPGVTYKVSFDYQSGSDDIYGFMVGNGEFQSGSGQITKLKKALGEDGHYSDIVTGGENGQTWIGIYSTSVGPDYQGTGGSAANFGGYKDFVLDNLVIEKIDIDKTILADLVAGVKADYNKADYTKDTWAVLEEALAHAEDVIAMEAPTEDEIMEAYAAVKEAVSGLVKIDPEALRDLPLAGMKATAGSEQATSGGEGPASNVLDNNAGSIWHTVWAGTAQSNQWIDIELAEPTTVGGVRMLPRSGGGNGAIQRAEIWVKTADSADYIKVVDDAAFGTGGWSKVTFEDVENVTNVKIQPLQTVGGNRYGSAAEIRIMKGEEQAVVPETDKTWLDELIVYAQGQQSDKDYQYVVPVVKEAFEAALAEAVAVSGNAEATQEDIDAAYDKLLNMVHYLGFVGNSQSLRTSVETARGYNEKLYTAESWAPFADALAQAEAILADENALQAEIDVAKDVLDAAAAALVRIPVDKTKLQKLVDKAQKYVADKDLYTPATRDFFLSVLADAEAVLANEEASQEEIDAAYAALQEAIFGLRLIPDKDKLEDLIGKAEKVDVADYTAESAAAFTAALDKARAVFADENATKEDVKAAEKALKDAQKDLVAKADADKKGNDKVASSDGSGSNTKSQPKTADAAQPLFVMMLAAVSGFLAMFSYKRKRR